jgi:DNA-binding NarL/FixJ family response regulator
MNRDTLQLAPGDGSHYRTRLWVTRRLRQLGPQPRILLYAAFADEALAIAAVVAGADGVLGISSIGEELCVAIRRLVGGTASCPRSPRVTSPGDARAARPAPPSDLRDVGARHLAGTDHRTASDRDSTA